MMDKDKWLDISDEIARTYLYKDGQSLLIEQPDKINISISSLGGHSHRIVTKDKRGYYIAPGWVAISWAVTEGQPVFKF